MAKHQWMTHGYQLRCPFRRLNTRKPRNFERVALGIVGKPAQHSGFDSHKCVRLGRSSRVALESYVDHARRALGIVVRELVRLHRGNTRIESPAFQDSRSDSATRNAFARPSANTSPDPCHFTGVTSLPYSLTLAGRNLVNPGRCRKLTVSCARYRAKRG